MIDCDCTSTKFTNDERSLTNVLPSLPFQYQNGPYQAGETEVNPDMATLTTGVKGKCIAFVVVESV
jgi:hypothetical protein